MLLTGAVPVELDRYERLALLKAMVILGMADGDFGEEERRMLDAILDASGFSEADRDAVRAVEEESPSIGATLAGVTRPQSQRWILHQLLNVAWADDDYTEPEQACIAAAANEMELGADWVAALEQWFEEGRTWMKRGARLLELPEAEV